MIWATEADATTSLYAIDDITNSILSFDRTTGSASLMGDTGAGGDFGDLAFDTHHHVLYWAPGRNNNTLYTINQNTGSATAVGVHGIANLFGLAYDTQNDFLYGASTDLNLYRIDPHTGAATLIGFDGVYPGGLAYVAATDTLFLTIAGGNALYSIDKTTGAATQFSPGAGFLDDNSITWDPLLNVFWVAEYGTGFIYQYNSNFSSRNILTTYPDFLGGIAFVTDEQAVPEPESGTLLLAGLIVLASHRRWRRAA